MKNGGTAMNIMIENVGKIRHADIAIDGITVIAGENGSGKSTVGKALYAAFNSLHNSDEKIVRMRQKGIEDEIRAARRIDLRSRSAMPALPYASVSNVATTIINDDLDVDAIVNQLRELFDQRLISAVEERFSGGLASVAEKIRSILDVTDDEAFLAIATEDLRTEFNGQINSALHDDAGKICLTIKQHATAFSLRKDTVDTVSERNTLVSQPFYLDDPHVIDDMSPYSFRSSRFLSGHQDDLRDALARAMRLQPEPSFDRIIWEKKTHRIMEIVNQVCPGSFSREAGGGGTRYVEEDSPGITPGNLSDGLKAFVILKTLLEFGAIQEGSLIVFDEPEIHLHPAWQIAFAEIIVLMQKHLDLHILINTHSPYFMRAIETFSAKHEVAHRCAYYQSSVDVYGAATFTNVTRDTNVIYASLAAPFQALETMYWETR